MPRDDLEFQMMAGRCFFFSPCMMVLDENGPVIFK
jgi:hypothetical protein